MWAFHPDGRINRTESSSFASILNQLEFVEVDPLKIIRVLLSCKLSAPNEAIDCGISASPIVEISPQNINIADFTPSSRGSLYSTFGASSIDSTDRSIA